VNHQPGSGYNRDISTQLQLFCSVMEGSELLSKVFRRASTVGLGDYYVGAGCLAQTMWNYLSGYEPTYGIKDIDFAYFDASNLTYEGEHEVVRQVLALYADIPIEVDVKNQARVHLWYESHFGYAIEPHRSLEAALNTWPTTATAIGARWEPATGWTVYAPFGLNDLLGMIVRPNRGRITRAIYEKKVARWTSCWPELRVIPW